MAAKIRGTSSEYDALVRAGRQKWRGAGAISNLRFEMGRSICCAILFQEPNWPFALSIRGPCVRRAPPIAIRTPCQTRQRTPKPKTKWLQKSEIGIVRSAGGKAPARDAKPQCPT